jgi:hypothetical protein
MACRKYMNQYIRFVSYAMLIGAHEIWYCDVEAILSSSCRMFFGVCCQTSAIGVEGLGAFWNANHIATRAFTTSCISAIALPWLSQHAVCVNTLIECSATCCNYIAAAVLVCVTWSNAKTRITPFTLVLMEGLEKSGAIVPQQSRLLCFAASLTALQHPAVLLRRVHE